MCRTLCKAKQCCLSLIVEERAEEKVSTRITRDGELWEGDDLYALGVSLQYQSLYSLDIVLAVSDPHEGDSGCDLDKSMLHITLLL